MTRYVFDQLTDQQHLRFDPELDSLHFAAADQSAAAVRLAIEGGSLSFKLAGKTIWLDAVSIGQLSVTNVTFANGSRLIIGDGTTDQLADWYGQEYGALIESPLGNQIWGLGGADFIEGGAGNDWLVANPSITTAIHLSSVGGVGAPTASGSVSISADGDRIGFQGSWAAFGTAAGDSGDAVVKILSAGTAQIEDRSSAGQDALSGTGAPMIAADGRSLVFVSAATNLVAGAASGGLYDVYLSDIGSSFIERVSTGSDGELAQDGRSLNPDLSGNGRYVVFESTASNWAPGGSVAAVDVFVKDRETGALVRASTGLLGGDGSGDSLHPKISADGRFVVFDSAAADLTMDDTNARIDVFISDRIEGGLINLASLMRNAPSSFPNNDSVKPDVAADSGYGGVVVFQTARALVEGDVASNVDIYAFDLRDNTFRLVSATASGASVQLASEDASISGDGRFVSFTSYSNALVPGDSNGERDIFVKDLATGRIALVSASPSGVPGNGPSSRSQISLGGEWIVFESSATNLAGVDGNGASGDVFRFWNPLFQDTLVGGAGNDTFEFPATANGRDLIQDPMAGDAIRIASASLATPAVPGDGKTVGLNRTELSVGGGVSLVLIGTDTVPGADVSVLLEGEFAATSFDAVGPLLALTGQGSASGDARVNALEDVLSSGALPALPAAGPGEYLLGALPAHGAATVSRDGAFTYLGARDFFGNDVFGYQVTDTLGVSRSYTVSVSVAGVTDTITGGAGVDTLVDTTQGPSLINGLAGNDIITGGSGNDTIDGGAGLDEARFSAARSAYGLEKLASGDLQITGPDGVDALRAVERTVFTDGALGFDVDGTGGKSYRLYQAAFDRMPDVAGVGFWMYAIDRGFSLVDAAANFMNSDEFRVLYGTNPSNADFMDLLYRNVMNRAPDDGYFFWLDALDGKGQFLGNPFPKAAVLAQFSESAENQANVIGVISNGFAYLPYTPA